MAVVFTPWFAWEERREIPGNRMAGVYCLAHFAQAPPGPADPLAREVVYIGHTKRRLKRRWHNFNVSASHIGPTEKFGHSGGRRYWRARGGDMSNLYVACCTFTGFDIHAEDNCIRDLENQLIVAYRERWGERPQFCARD